jgi:integrase
MMGLGPLALVGLAEAREKALEARRLLLEGMDPIGDRAQRRGVAKATSAKSMAFDQCAKAYITAHHAGWHNAKHAAQWTATLKAYASPIFGSLPVKAIDTSLVMKALEPIWVAKTETASRVRARIETILDWARVCGHRDGENPARWRGHLDHLLPARGDVRSVTHHAAMPYVEIPAFMSELSAQTAPPMQALKFLILTAARTGEVLGATWDEIDLASKIWTIPASRMKAGREHRVPLSPAAIGVLERMAGVRENELVFPGTQTARMSSMALLTALRRTQPRVSVHGFRATFKTWASETTGFPNEAVEVALAHSVGTAVEAAYRRGDMLDVRRRLMCAWSDYCIPGEVGNVVSLRA